MNTCADDARVACPLFQAEYGGSQPTSALHLRFSRMDIHRALKLNREWHSRLPELTNWQGCLAFGAECNNVTYAVALWGQPVARMLNGRGWIELRRMAIADDAPKNTASRMIGWMLRELRKDGRWTRAISYQDTAVHAGTIYKASGWTVGNRSKGGEWSRPSRGRDKVQTASEKVRWEYAFTCTPNAEHHARSGSDVVVNALVGRSVTQRSTDIKLTGIDSKLIEENRTEK